MDNQLTPGYFKLSHADSFNERHQVIERLPLIPVIFKKLGVDPAVASGPLITTVNDLVAVVTYYGLVWLLILSVLQV